ncbi:AAA family ATPase [Marinobacterium stanieri]|uniref:AAA family ATPase n=1 Tax=Marinobacterium stanieri TaxID=49186 RepID=UPI003A95B321
MSKELMDVAEQLRSSPKKVQLIYAFNGTGKTRLSRAFKDLVAPKSDDAEDTSLSRDKILYYNAFTEDLFYWDNDLENDGEPKLKIQPNSFTDWVLKDQGQDFNIITNFQKYARQTLTPHFNPEFSEVTFSIESGDNAGSGRLKISKGEESNFVWSIFYTLLQQVVSILNVPEPDERETDQFNQLQYVFIDDPVSSLDDNHLIELAVELAALISSSESDVKFIITTHNPLFYNVLHNELGLNKGNKKDGCFLLQRYEDGKFDLDVRFGDSNRSFSYHLYLKNTLEEAIAADRVERYHFTLIRNLYEKAASFLGYPKWSELLPGEKTTYYNRIIQFTSHSSLSNESVPTPSPQEKQTVKLLLEHLTDNYGFWKQEEPNA